MSAIWVNQGQFNTPFKLTFTHEHNALNLANLAFMCPFFYLFISLSIDNDQRITIMSLRDSDLVCFDLV